MTNKVKPFFIRITDDMTPQMVQDAFDKCVDAGAKLDEGCRGVKSKHEYKKQYKPSNFKFFGVDDSFMTYMDVDLEYFTNAQEITLDQLDKWLGLELEQEWKNGDECINGGAKYIYVSKHPLRDSSSICVHLENGLTYSLFTDELSKPETPEQKAERERLEAAKDLAYAYWGVKTNSEPSDELLKAMLRIVDKTGYRKQ